MSAGTAQEVRLTSLAPGSWIDVETKNRHYHIECLGGATMRISGHPEICPVPVVAHLRGSMDRDGAVQRGIIKPDHYLVFELDSHTPVTTSKVLNVHVSPPVGCADSLASR